MAWIMTSAALVLLMVPGVGFFYSGLARRKSALSLIWLSMMSIAVVGFQWFFWGYSLTFSHTGSSFIGDLSNFGLMKVLGQPSVGSSKVPDLLFCLYQGMFAAITYVCTPHIDRAEHCTDRVTVPLSPLEPPQTVAACFQRLSSCSSGPL
jgi:ammonia channel protein AmtB